MSRTSTLSTVCYSVHYMFFFNMSCCLIVISLIKNAKFRILIEHFDFSLHPNILCLLIKVEKYLSLCKCTTQITDVLLLQSSILTYGTQLWSLCVNEELLPLFLTLCILLGRCSSSHLFCCTGKSGDGSTFSIIQSWILLHFQRQSHLFWPDRRELGIQDESRMGPSSFSFLRMTHGNVFRIWQYRCLTG